MPLDDQNLLNRRVSVSLMRLMRVKDRCRMAHTLIRLEGSGQSLAQDLDTVALELEGMLHDLGEMYEVAA